ncbi:MAG: packaged DNA stabilization protein [Plesiomonas shigelloides]
MPEVKFPLVKGKGRSAKNADYIDLLPTNIIPIGVEAENASGYFRFWPGLVKKFDVDGVSRGSHWNTVKQGVYRVAGGKLYLNGAAVGDVSGSGRVAMAHSRTSQAVSVGGKLVLHRYDGEVKVFDNWPKTTTYPGKTVTVKESQHSKDGDTLKVTTSNETGQITLTVTPTNGANKVGAPLSIKESEWSSGVSQSTPASGIPYITDLKVQGVKYPGAELRVVYTFNANGGNTSDISKLVWVQDVPDVTVENNQYDFAPVGDVCRIKGRYVFATAGTDAFFVSDIEDESKPALTAAKYRAETMPDGILAMRQWREYLAAFGSSTIQFFAGPSGDERNLFQAVGGYTIPVGIAGQWAITEYADTFAFITNASSGQFTVGIMGQGSWTDIADRHIKKLLAKYSQDEMSNVVIEGLKDLDCQYLILHLPNETVVFNGSTNLWSIIKTGLYDGVHRAIDYRNEGGLITCGDKISGFIAELSDTVSSQYTDDQEIILYTPIMTLERMMLFDLRITSNTGCASTATRMFISSTEDGIIYSPEKLILLDKPLQWISNVISQQVGYCKMRIGFKLRVVGASPVTLSDLRMRVE